jgi:hypothetical protein
MATEGYFFVADLLGFGKIIKNLSDDQSSARVEEWVALVSGAMKAESITRFQLISDTVFAANPGTVEGLRQLVRVSRRLLTDGVAASLPVRGAITFGSYTWGSDLIYGKAVVDAHSLEMSQNWVGISGGGLPHAQSCYGFGELLLYLPPMKRGPVTVHPVVDWTIPNSDQLAILLTQGGLATGNEIVTWELGEKLTNTSVFALYKKAIKDKGLSPAIFHGALPVRQLE